MGQLCGPRPGQHGARIGSVVFSWRGWRRNEQEAVVGGIASTIFLLAGGTVRISLA